MSKTKSLLFAALFAMPILSHAHWGHTHPVNSRQENQAARIKEGVRSGELTRREADYLRREQRQLRIEERRYRANGVLSRWERAELQRELNEANRHIYRQKHDRQDRDQYRYWYWY